MSSKRFQLRPTRPKFCYHIGMIGGGVFAIISGLYAWQVHGLFFGVLAALAMLVFTVVANSIYMNRMMNSEDDDLEKAKKHFQIIKWVIFILIMITIAVTGAEIVSVPIGG